MTVLSGQQEIDIYYYPEQLPDKVVNGPVMIKAMSTNENILYIGLDESGYGITSTTGFELTAGDVIVFDFIGNLNTLWVATSGGGDKLCWILLNV